MCKRAFVVAFGLLFSMTLLGSTETDFKRFQEYARSKKEKSLETMQAFQPGTTFKNYNEHPPEESHYKNVETEKTDLTEASTDALKKDKGGQTVVDNFGKHQVEINPNSPEVQRGKLIEDESYAITHGISNERVKCDEKPPVCEMKDHLETCHASRQLPNQTCTKRLNVAVDVERLSQLVAVEVMVAKKYTGVISINLFTGAITNAISGHVSTVKALKEPCEQMTAVIHFIRNNGQSADWVQAMGLPTCENKGQLSLFISKSFKRDYPIQIRLSLDLRSKPFIKEERWDNGCEALERQGNLCHLSQEQCTDAQNPHDIDGLAVTRACWEKTITYACSSAVTDECRTQKEKGCLQVNSKCIETSNSLCSLYEQVYRCPEKVCAAPIACIKQLFCADGDCVKPTPTQNEHFAEDAAAFNVAVDSGAEFKNTQATLFGGHVARCKIWALDIIDCCSDKGWGKKIDLLHCKPDDKALGKAKLDYLVHYLGEYCATKELGVCIEHKRTYCVFDTKMARLIQEEGRLTQLNAGALGTAEEPHCEGLSVQELQNIDMGKIDFLNPRYPFGEEGEPTPEAGILVNPPNSGTTTDELIRRVEKKVGGA